MPAAPAQWPRAARVVGARSLLGAALQHCLGPYLAFVAGAALVVLAGCGSEAANPTQLRAVQWNTGSGGAAAPDVGWTAAHKTHGDTWYGNGLAWQPAIAEASAWLSSVNADVLAIEEVFDPASDCAGIPAGPEGFVCDSWTAGDPSVVTTVLGAGWQIGCFPGKPDKCLAVRRDALTIDGCAGDACDEALVGALVDGCGSGARVAWVDATTTSGEALRVVGLHGSSGITASDQTCREAQLEAAFAALREAPVGLLLGDANTDPTRLLAVDTSAVALADHLAAGDVTLISPLDPPGYGGVVTIDHAVARGLTGACAVPGVTDGEPPATGLALFDHHPLRCDLTLPAAAAE